MPENRNTYLGGTDIAALAGIDRFRNPATVYQQKRGELAPTKVNPDMKRGLFLEDHIRDIVAVETGYWVQHAAFRRHPNLKWAGGTPDGYLKAKDETGRQDQGILEIKAPRSFVCQKVNDEGPLPAWVTQVQWYMELTGLQWAMIAIFNADEWTLRTFEIEADPELQEKLIALGNSFWLDMKRGKPPSETVEPVTIPIISGDAELREDTDWMTAMESYRSAYHLKKQAEDLEASAKARLKELAGEYGRYMGGGGKVSYMLQEGRSTFKPQLFEIDHPAIPLDPYYKRGQPFERFLVTVSEVTE